MADRRRRDYLLHPIKAVKNRKPGTHSDASSISSDQDKPERLSRSAHGSGPGPDHPSLDPIAVINIPPGEYWDNAYERLKSIEPTMMHHYEKVLSKHFGATQDKTSDSQSQNVIDNRRDNRRLQMEALLDSTLDRMNKHSGPKEKLGVATNVVLSLKSPVKSFLESVTPLHWLGVGYAWHLK